MAQITDTVQWQPPVPVQPGVEMAALTPFLFDCVWTGKVEAEGMGPGSPEMEAVGKAVFKPIIDGAWLAGDFEQEQFVGGEKVTTWKAHYVVGWDPRAGEYRATYVDSNGSSCLLRGHIEGNQFVNETFGEGPVQLRLTWEALDAAHVTWRNECSVDGGPWFLVEEYDCTPL